MKFVCILTTAPRLLIAEKLAQGLIRNKLAACVNLIPAVKSRYRWKNKIVKSSEVQLIIKTRAAFFKKVETFLKKNHPYDVPEIIALPILQGSQTYLDWIAQVTE